MKITSPLSLQQNAFDQAATSNLRPQELEVVYAISRAVAQSVDIDRALDEIIRLTRSVFIFDNIIVYLGQEGDSPEPRFARIIGRGRSAEANLAWGETTALESMMQAHNVLRQEKTDGWEDDRLAWRQFLGLPLNATDSVLGALVFGRFGGPDFTPEQIHLAEFIAMHVAQLLNRQQLVSRIATLEAEKRLGQLQADFIAMVSHELCTPLGFIKGYATTLLREDTTWDEASRHEFLTIIDEEADRLRELIDSLLDSSRLQAGTLKIELATVRLDTLLREIASRAMARHPGLAIQFNLQNNVLIQADSTRLAQVFDNLIGNAFKYAPGSPIIISMQAENDHVAMEVQDHGPGIPLEHQSHLFERFYRVPGSQNATRGTGLGLYICRQLVQAHYGEIGVRSIPGEGTTFHIRLPLNVS